MITTKGKGIVARALAGQLDSAFSYIALGVGAKPSTPPSVTVRTAAEWTSLNPTLASGEWGMESDTKYVKKGNGSTAWNSLGYIGSGIQYEDSSLKNKTKLDFEALRIPISGASVLYEGGQTKLLLSGTVPSTQRYEFSEVAAFSAESNSLLTTESPRLIYTFSDVEGWELHSSGIADIGYAASISSNNLDINNIPSGVDAKAFFVSSESPVFYATNRVNQRVRVYEDALLVRRNLSTINRGTTPWTLGGDHIHVTSTLVNLTKARPDDELKIAFSILNTTYASITDAGVSDEVRIVVKFTNSEVSSEYALMQVKVIHGGTDTTVYPSTAQFHQNGYYVASAQKKDLYVTSNFSWDDVTVAQIYVDADPGTGPTDADYYVALDALRFDSNNDNNPTYGMTAYSVVQNSSASTQIKDAQTESQIEFKIAIEVPEP